MKKIIHLSDLHFSRVNNALIPPLEAVIQEIDPDIIAISGDLTQRAKKNEFLAAKAFIETLPGVKIIVPGNHDVPWRLIKRIFKAFENYKIFISEDLEPFYADNEVALLGINTAHRLTVKGGRLKLRHRKLIQQHLKGLDKNLIKIIVAHHAFDLPEKFPKRKLVAGAKNAMRDIAECGVDIILGGHMHIGHFGSTATRYKVDGHAALVIQAGSAISTRQRGEAESFNVIYAEDQTSAEPRIRLERYSWHAASEKFRVSLAQSYARGTSGWQQI